MAERSDTKRESEVGRNAPPDTESSTSTEVERMAAEEALIGAGVRERLMQLAQDLGMENLDFLTRPQQ